MIVVAMLSIAQAGGPSVLVRDNSFNPENTFAAVGQSVFWSGDSARRAHNVRQDRKLFYSGPTEVSLTYQRVFSAGTFDYFCENHGSRSSGMDGTVKVPVTLIEDPLGPEFTVVWATASSNTGSKFTVEYRADSGAWTMWKEATSARKAIFGSAELGMSYDFRAQSMKNGRASKWSPVASITT